MNVTQRAFRCDASFALVSFLMGLWALHSSNTPVLTDTPFEDTSMKKSLLLASLIAAMALAACGKKEEPVAEVAPAASEASAPAEVASAPEAASDAAVAAPEAASAASAAASN
ncbi:MAG: hypothetical protein ACK4MG_11185 [Aquabacterium sp.]